VLNLDQLREIVQVLKEGKWDYASIATEEFSLTVGTSPAGGVVAEPPSPVISTPLQQAPVSNVEVPTSQMQITSESATVISAPSVGSIWRAPKPGADPFVEIGTEVNAGDTLCILEVMKLFMPIQSEVSGTVVAVHVQNGEMVEHGQALFSVEAK
jgi:acetyl-CoA carboxylase biotin carboxyl carrier protein